MPAFVNPWEIELVEFPVDLRKQLFYIPDENNTKNVKLESATKKGKIKYHRTNDSRIRKL